MADADWYRSWQDVRPEDSEQVVQLLQTGSVSIVSGGVMARFEKRFAAFAGTRHSVSFNNGTAALYAALWACGVGPGSDVLMCDYGFHGMAAAVLSLGARVVVVDCRADSLTMDPADLARARTPQTAAVLVHNPWGVPADYRALREACPDRPLIADASHAHGATLDGRPLGAWADIACFSLGHQKLITGGELGGAATDRGDLRDRMLVLGHVNRVPADLQTLDWKGNAVGLKLRPHAVALTLAFPQLKRFPEKLASLRATCSRLERAFAAHDLRGQAVPAGGERSWWRIVLRLGPSWDGIEAVVVEAALKSIGVPVEPDHYSPTLQDQEIFRWPGHEKLLLARPCPTAGANRGRLITLPAPATLPEALLEAVERDLPGCLARVRSGQS